MYTAGSRPAPAQVTVTLFFKQGAANCCTCPPWQWAVTVALKRGTGSSSINNSTKAKCFLLHQ